MKSNTSSTTKISRPKIDAADERYTFDEEKLVEYRKKAPWRNDPMYFDSVVVSPSALTKMCRHVQSGVQKGINQGGSPIEVMGLLHGRPDPNTPKTLVVTDAFPLPIEGFETRVIADDQEVVNHMIELGDNLELTRKEKFMGWYHSHPFDLGPNSHCFLSQTDITTQLQWQRLEDPNGNPFLAIVLDPLRSLAKSTPELKAFRVYPPEYSHPVPNMCPDGNVVPDEKTRLEKWGSCWNRYYELKIDYFMSHRARNVMNILTQNFLWMRMLSSSNGFDTESKEQNLTQMKEVSNKVEKIDMGHISRSMGFSDGKMRGGGTGSGSGRSDTALSSESQKDVSNACQGVINVTTKKLHANIVQIAKKDLFS